MLIGRNRERTKEVIDKKMNVNEIQKLVRW